MEKSGRGKWRLPIIDVVTYLTGDGVGNAGITAARELELTTQLAGYEVYAVPGPVPHSLPAFTFVSSLGQKARATAHLSPVEVAVLEVLGRWTAVLEVSPNEAVATLVEILSSDAVSSRILTAGTTDETPAARKRLKFVLQVASLEELVMRVHRVVITRKRANALVGLTPGCVEQLLHRVHRERR